MSENDDLFINKTKKFLRSEICPLTDSEKCEKAVRDFGEHADPLRLVDDVFNAMMKCDLEKCEINEGTIKEKLEKFIKEIHGENALG